MDEINPDQQWRLNSAPLESDKASAKVDWRLFLGPLAGLIALFAAAITYRPLDYTLIWWVGAVPCVISYTLTNIAFRKFKRGEDVRSFFPITTWLELGCFWFL
jgi:hypothetical protein